MNIKDVAKLAGVSAITVSRVLNGNYYVSPETTQKVLKAVQTLNYKPSAIARSLRNNKTRVIGVIVPDISNPYFMRLVRSFENLARVDKYAMLLASSDEDPIKEKEILDLLETRTDGLVIATCQSNSNETSKRFTQVDIPMVLVDRLLEGSGIATVVEENEQSAYELVKHLIMLGHRDIAIINGGTPNSTVAARQRGYQQALEESGIPLNEEWLFRDKCDERTGYVYGKSLFNSPHRPSAVFCANNSITVGVMLAIRELGFSIPDDISVVSFGDLLLSELITPKITAVIQDPDAVGSAAARILLQTLAGKKQASGETLVLPTYIRLGDSVRPYNRNS